MNTIPAGAGPAPVPKTPKGPGLGLILMIGGLLFLIAIIAVGFFVVLPLLVEEEPGISPGGSSIPYDQTTSGNYQPAADSSGSLLSGSPGYSSVSTIATTGISPPVQVSGSSSTDDLIIGTWDIESSFLQMQFSAGGAATLQNPASGEYATGSWEKISDGKYRLRSPSGTEYPVLLLDPIAGTMYFEDYSMVFIGKG